MNQNERKIRSLPANPRRTNIPARASNGFRHMWTRLSAFLLAALCGILTSSAADTPTDFPYVVPWEAGDAEFAAGDSITINQVRGTSPTIATGATFCVEGVYTLASRDEAEISIYVTSKSSTPTPVDPQQTMTVSRGSGAFRLVKTMYEEGFPHVSFYPVPYGSSFGGVYFGQGEGVLRNKGWSVATSSVSSAAAPGTQSAPDNQIGFGAHVDPPGAQATTAGANQVLFEYLGNSVEIPGNLDPKYSQEGLSNALRTAVEKSGASLDIHIEDSEFPFLVGVTGTGARASYAKFMAELKQMGYSDQGSVGSETCQSMNIIPYSAFPRDASQRISRRLTVRLQMFFDRMTSGTSK